MSVFEKSYEVLNAVLREDAYVNIAVKNFADDSDRPTILKIVYGTIENYYSLSYFISTLAAIPPKPIIKIIMLQALYALKFLKIPPYAVVNESVELTKKLGKCEQASFVNALLKRASSIPIPVPSKRDTRFEEVKYNLPSWLISVVKKQYPEDFERILSANPREEEHVRLSARYSSEEFEKAVPEFERTDCGYYVRNTETVKKLFSEGKLTYQSYTSVKAVEAFGNINGKSFIDVCAAPGGKSVLAAEKGAKVTACDLYPHRVELIKSYAKRMNVGLKTVISDATADNKEFLNAFDCVLTDVPCSGLGAINRRRDVVFKRTPEDIRSLIGVQNKILENASKYVKSGGILVYSTCTILHEENSRMIVRFLEAHREFTRDNLPFADNFQMQYLQNSEGLDGFYVARLKKL